MALGGAGYFHAGYFHDNFWHVGFWADGGGVVGTAPRTNGFVRIILTASEVNNRVPVRYVEYGSERAVPVLTVDTPGIGIVPAYETTGPNVVPVTEVEPE